MEGTIQELVAAAKGGSESARRQAWRRVIEAREVLWKPEFRTMRQVAGQETLATMKATIAWASRELKALK